MNLKRRVTRNNSARTPPSRVRQNVQIKFETSRLKILGKLSIWGDMGQGGIIGKTYPNLVNELAEDSFKADKLLWTWQLDRLDWAFRNKEGHKVTFVPVTTWHLELLRATVYWQDGVYPIPLFPANIWSPRVVQPKNNWTIASKHSTVNNTHTSPRRLLKSVSVQWERPRTRRILMPQWANLVCLTIIWEACNRSTPWHF